MHTLRVSTRSASYAVYSGAGVLRDIAGYLKRAGMGDRLFMVTNHDVFGLYGFTLKRYLQEAGFEVNVLPVPDGEEFKSLETAGRLYTELGTHFAERGTPVLALGGGVIGDLAGFVAATYMRGVPLIQVPTTLLAQVDSSIGGKTGVNHGSFKNQVGVFYQPCAVFADTSVLKTLPAIQLSNGLAEVIKSAVVGDRRLFAFLEQNMPGIRDFDEKALETAIVHAARVKARIVSRDERDLGPRGMLNFGHTVGHAVEAVTDFKVNHGTAVAFGMVVAGRVAVKLGLFLPADQQRLVSLLAAAGLPTEMPELNTADLLDAVKHDKKVSSGQVKFILPVRIGQVVITDKVALSDVAAALAE